MKILDLLTFQEDADTSDQLTAYDVNIEANTNTESDTNEIIIVNVPSDTYEEWTVRDDKIKELVDSET